jgi:hypothetical protein
MTRDRQQLVQELAKQHTIKATATLRCQLLHNRLKGLTPEEAHIVFGGPPHNNT